MKNELPKSTSKKTLDQQFRRHPHMYEQMEGIADQMEQAIAKGVTADEAEEMAIKQINELGRALLRDWAKVRQERSVEEVRKEKPSAIRDSKKTDLANDLWDSPDRGRNSAGRPARSPCAAFLPEGLRRTGGILARLAAGAE